MCNNPRVIFPFQLDTVVSCQVCQTCYHRQCFVPGKCPKCIRMEARRKLRTVPQSPDSPDSGEITFRASQADTEADAAKVHGVAARTVDQAGTGSVCEGR
ncbi:hypothetical protein EGW08_005760 [Elysia chlorotica]|uniref:Rubicon Homology domain-containing protein n=1 Tax=Elysia chlorotica TaxID=188477 RepID=A0A433TY62_ELYCH|nr:hypothetical protein EGW08_005760 [Elysia chlorotica]